MAHLYLSTRCFILVLIGISLFVVSCNYDPEGDYLDDIAPEDPPAPTIEIANIIRDTITIESDTSLQYTLTYQGGLLYAYRISTENKIWDQQYYDTGEGPANRYLNLVTIDADQLRNGTDILLIEMIFSSGSGSLADKVGADLYVTEREWVLVKK